MWHSVYSTQEVTQLERQDELVVFRMEIFHPDEESVRMLQIL